MLPTNRLLNRKRHSDRRPHRLPRPRLLLELLEARNLLDGGLANVLVNNPALDTTSQDTQNQTAIVLGRDNTVVVAYNDSAPFSADNPSTLGYSVSKNGGASFMDKGTFDPTPPYYTLGDPSLARSTKTGTIFMCTDTSTTLPDPSGTSPDGVTILADRINLYRSTDNGSTFGAPINATPGFGTGEFSLTRFANAWLAVDNYPGPGYGNVYLAWVAIRPGEYQVRAARSTDDGLTWEPSGGVTVPAKAGNPESVITLASDLTVGPDHTVYITALTENGAFKSQKIVMSRSTDEGQTFGAPVVVTSLRANGHLSYLGLTDSNGQVFRNLTLPQAAANPVTGDLYVIYPDKPKNQADKADIFFTQSTDGGNTWSDPLRVNDDATTNDQWQPALAVTPDGSHVGIFWYDRRLDQANNLIDRYGAIGQVAGHRVTFGANFRITDESFPPARGVDPVFPPDYAATGEYDHAVADNNSFYTTWGDSRLADAFHANQADVRLAKVPVNWLATNTLTTTSPASASITTPPSSAIAAAFSTPLADLSFASRTDFNDGGWGWYIDLNPAADGAFTTPGNQREQDRMNSLTALEQDLGQLLVREHEETGVMVDILPAGTRRTAGSDANLSDFSDVDWLRAWTELESVANRKMRP